LYNTESSEGEAAAYFIENGLVNGRSAEGYQLDEICSVQEMIVLAVRVFDHVIFADGNFSVGFLWEAAGVSNTVYLLGSIHISNASIYPLSRGMELAFARSANLVVEADILGMTDEEAEYYLEMAMIGPDSGQTIADFISEETYELYVEVFEMLGMPAEQYDYFKPWLAYSLLTVLMASGGDEEGMEEFMGLGIDMYFLMKALETGKNIMELESITFQVDLFASMDDALNEALLLSTLESILSIDDADETELNIEEVFQLMLDAFITGDEAELASLLETESDSDNPHLAEFNDILLTSRDIAMTEKIAGYLEETTFNGNYIVVVGALHLINDRSIVVQLKEMGYTVERILR
jgi:hypothetical protein